MSSNINELKHLKEVLNGVIDSHITEADVVEASARTKDFSVGEIKFLFERVSERLFDTSTGKNIISSFVCTCRRSEPLRKFFEITENIKNARGVSDNVTFINENFELYERFDKKSVKDLRDVAERAVMEAKVSTGEMDAIFEEYESSIDKAIAESIVLKRTPSNAKKRSNGICLISEKMGDRSEESPEIDAISKDDTILEKVNEVINNTPGFRALMEDLFLNHLMGGDYESLFESYKTKCKDSIDYIMDYDSGNCDIERMKTLREGLDKKKYQHETFYDDIIALCELDNVLNDDKESC